MIFFLFTNFRAEKKGDFLKGSILKYLSLKGSELIARFFAISMNLRSERVKIFREFETRKQ